MNKPTEYLLRTGLAFAFLYPAIASLVTPSDWIGFIPIFIRDIVDGNLFLLVLSLIEILAALGILFFKNPFYPTLLGSIILTFIIVFNLGIFAQIFRDVSILAMAIALMTHHKRS